MADLTGALGGAATGAKIGSAILPGVGTAVGGILGGLAGLFGGKSKKPAYQPLDISKVIAEARSAAETNYAQSYALEAKYRPGTAALRTTVDSALGDLAGNKTAGLSARDSLLKGLMADNGLNPLLVESSNRILGQLRLGGQLDAETQAAAMTAALSKGGAAGISGSGAARGLVARDLGLTSLSLQRQRQQDALSAGTTLQTNYLNALNAATSIAGQDIQKTGLIGSLIDARALPESGLSPGAIASLYVADNNAKNGVAATNATIDAYTRNSNLQALLGFGSEAAGTIKSAGGLKGILGGLMKTSSVGTNDLGFG